MKIFDYGSSQVGVFGYIFNKLEISIQVLMDFGGKNLQMSETDFEL